MRSKNQVKRDSWARMICHLKEQENLFNVVMMNFLTDILISETGVSKNQRNAVRDRQLPQIATIRSVVINGFERGMQNVASPRARISVANRKINADTTQKGKRGKKD